MEDISGYCGEYLSENTPGFDIDTTEYHGIDTYYRIDEHTNRNVRRSISDNFDIDNFTSDSDHSDQSGVEVNGVLDTNYSDT
ncbi:unnamed protein product [Aphanomyces euteiches]